MSINGKQPMCITAVSVLFLSKICFSYILYQTRPTKKLNFYTKYIKLAGYPVCMDKKIAVSWCRSPYGLLVGVGVTSGADQNDRRDWERDF